MAADIHSREQRLRKQAELQTINLNLANLRKQEASYIESSAAIPEILVNQIKEQRLKIQQVEDELSALEGEATPPRARQFYREAFEAEQVYDLEKALKLYKSAVRSSYPDAEAALRSVRYQQRISKSRPVSTSPNWASVAQARQRWLIGLGVILILILLVGFMIYGFSSFSSPEAAAVEPTAIATATTTPAEVILIIPETPTPLPTDTPAPAPTDTPPVISPAAPTVEILPTPSPAPSPTLRPAPRLLEPKDGLVWIDGAIVFEFAQMDLAYGELYCLNTLRGYDKTLTENWSFPATGSKKPTLVIDANVFRVARTQGMQCIVWSAAIGQDSCDNIISQSTEERVIGLPRPCEFK